MRCGGPVVVLTLSCVHAFQSPLSKLISSPIGSQISHKIPVRAATTLTTRPCDRDNHDSFHDAQRDSNGFHLSTSKARKRNFRTSLFAKAAFISSLVATITFIQSRIGKPLAATAAEITSAAATSTHVSLPVTAVVGAVSEAVALTQAPPLSLVDKFLKSWWLYSTIPMVSGLLNWATNKLAVQMIFYPIEFTGLRVRTWAEKPFGLFGWQGIVPCKAKPMASTMVNMMTTSLIDVKEVFGRVDPRRVSALLAPALDPTLKLLSADLGGGVGAWAWQNSESLREFERTFGQEFVESLVVKMQEHIDEVWDVEGQVVNALVKDKRLLVELFQACGREELKFVVRSGLWLGSLLGVAQMGLWLVWDPWWSLALGGAAVGFLTNLAAIKSIFSPVEPRRIGFRRKGWPGVTVQGLFLTRQREVATQFSSFLASRVLNSESIWREILFGPKSRPRFMALLEEHAQEVLDQRLGRRPGSSSSSSSSGGGSDGAPKAEGQAAAGPLNTVVRSAITANARNAVIMRNQTLLPPAPHGAVSKSPTSSAPVASPDNALAPQPAPPPPLTDSPPPSSSSSSLTTPLSACDPSPAARVVALRVARALEHEVWRLHEYVDERLDLRAEMETQMRGMSPQEFEKVLHPIFQEDEATLIALGAALGLTAGWAQSLAPY